MAKSKTPHSAESGDSAATPTSPREPRRRSPAGQSTVTRFNRRLFLILLVIVGVSAGGIHVLHGFMVDRNSGELLKRAAAAETAGKNKDAIRLLSQYQKLQPDDVDAKEQLGHLLAKQEDTPKTWRQVFVTFEDVLRRDPKREHLRQPLIDVAMKMRQFPAAEAHINALLERDVDAADAELIQLKAKARLGQDKPRDAMACYVWAIDRDPTAIEPYAELVELFQAEGTLPLRADMASVDVSPTDDEVITLAEVLQDSENTPILAAFPEKRGEFSVTEAAEIVLAELVKNGAPSWQSRQVRANYYYRLALAETTLAVRLEKFKRAATDLKRALASSEAESDSELLMLAANIEMALADELTKLGSTGADDAAAEIEEHRDAAMQYGKQGLKAVPVEPRFYLVLAQLEGGGLESTEDKTADGVVASLKRLREGVAVVDELKEDSKLDFDAAARLTETEMVLRWPLADLLVSQAELQIEGQRPDATSIKAVRSEVEAELEKMIAAGARPEFSDLVEGRLLVYERDWQAAAQKFEVLRPKFAGAPDLNRRLVLLLDQCYTQLQNPDRRILVLRQALAADSGWLQGQLALGSALVEAGRIDEAIALYGNQSLASQPGVARLRAQLLLAEESTKAGSQRDASQLQAAIDAAERTSPNSATTALLRSELLVSQGKFDEADELLKAFPADASGYLQVWLARVELAATRSDGESDARVKAIEELVANAEPQHENAVEVRLGKTLLASLKHPETSQSLLVSTASAAESYSKEDRDRLLQGLIQQARLAGDKETVVRLWEIAAKANAGSDSRSDRLPIWISLAQAALDAGDSKAFDNALAEIRRLEGAKGPNGDFLKALSILNGIAKDESLRNDQGRLKEELDKPRVLLASAAKERGSWAAIPKAQGLLERMAGDEKAAIQYFERALGLGDVSPEVVQSLVAYYRSKRQTDKARAILAQAGLAGSAAMADEIRRLDWQLALEAKDLTKALVIAEANPESLDDYREMLGEAQLLLATYQARPQAERGDEAGRKLVEKAGELLNQAVTAAPGEPRTWASLVAFSKATGDEAGVKKALDDAVAKLPAEPRSTRFMNLASLYEIAGENDKALKNYEGSIEADPTNADARLAAAVFLAKNKKLDEARKHVEWVVAQDTGSADPALKQRAKILGAAITAASGRYADTQKALAELNANSEGGEATIEELRAQLALLSGRVSRRDKNKVIGILEEIQKRAELTPEDRFKLAALYEQVGDWAKSKQILEELVRVDSTNAQYLFGLVVGSLRHETIDKRLEIELGRELDRLKLVEPDALRTLIAQAEFEVAVSRSEVLDDQTEVDRARRIENAQKLLTSYAESVTSEESEGRSVVTPVELAGLQAVAQRAEELQLDSAAETLFRAFAKHSLQPNNRLLLAMYLGRQGRYDEALNVVEERPKETNPEAAALTAVTVVSVGQPTETHLARAEAVVMEALQANPSSLSAASILAGLRLSQKQYDESERMYRKILADNPGDVSAMNNLAWLLAISGKNLSEAESIVNEAIATAGPVADLIDTRGIILLALNRPQEAIAELNEAYSEKKTPTMAFHLALAYEQMGDRSTASEKFAEAEALGLSLDKLHSSEHETYERLADVL